MTCSEILTPLSQTEVSNQNNLPSLNYTNQDYSSLKTRLVTFIKQRAGNKFNDYVEGSLAIVLFEIWSFIADMISFKADQNANEIYIDTVAELENAFRIARLVGFQPTPPIAAKAMFSAIIQSPLVTDLIIPAGLRFDLSANGNPISYELYASDAENQPIFDQDIIIQAGNISNTSIVGLEGTTVVDNFSSTGELSQTYTLTTIPVLYDSIRVDVDGQRWDRVEYFTDSSGRNEYRVEFSSQWQGFIIFGNGSAGRSPSTGSNIQITYRTGGGTIGNIITGSIDTQRGFVVPGFNFSIAVSFRNYTKGDYGYDGDTIDNIREKLPKWVKTQDRAVTGQDYKTLADQFVSPYNGQIGKSLPALRNYGCAGNVIDIFVLAKDGTNGLTEASDSLKKELVDFITTKKMMSDYVCIKDGEVIYVDLSIDVIVDKFYRKFKDEIERKINLRISDFFALSNWDYGESLKETDILRVLSGMNEIIEVNVTFTTTDPDNGGTMVTTKYYQIIRSDTITLNLVFQ